MYLALRNPNGQLERHACRDHTVTPDGLHARCLDLRIGNVQSIGTFRDKKGRRWVRHWPLPTARRRPEKRIDGIKSTVGSSPTANPVQVAVAKP